MSFISDNDRTLMWAIVNAFRQPDCPLTTDQIAERGVRFLNDLSEDGASGIGDLRLLLTALTIPILNLTNPSSRDAVRRRLDEMEHGIELARDLARTAQRLAIFLIYATLDAAGQPRAAQQLGYERFPDRRNPQPIVPDEDFLPVDAWVPPNAKLPPREYDVVVIGSGSGGAVIARRLCDEGSLRVALVETGDYVPESWRAAPPTGIPRPFPWDELENLRRYFKGGGFQLAQGVRMFVFQGSCLGGSSVVNNAVCFRMPPWVRETWRTTYGVPWVDASLDEAYDRIRQDLGIDSVENVVEPGFLNPTGERLRQGAAAIGMDPARDIPACEVNLGHSGKCLGCGYCNLTCGYLRKNSVLQAMLPGAWKTGRLTVYTGRQAVRIVGATVNGRFAATGVAVRARRHELGGHGTIRANKVVVSAGAVASSALLLRTTEIAGTGLPIGEHFSCNFASPMNADYDAPVRAFDGLQIAHYYLPNRPDGFVIETWFNPPATQSLTLPGWMDELQRNIDRYQFYACAAPVVGSTNKSRITAAGEQDRIHFDFGPSDLERLKEGLLMTCRLFFHSTPPPRRILLGTPDNWEVHDDTYEDRIQAIENLSSIQIGTSHPQGGNGLSAGPREGVVGPDFRVHGTRNVYVADASVFPTSIGVNPHWTVMAIADLAAMRIAES
jgi:choline dehydrogenase-like flavoprotein